MDKKRRNVLLAVAALVVLLVLCVVMYECTMDFFYEEPEQEDVVREPLSFPEPEEPQVPQEEEEVEERVSAVVLYQATEVLVALEEAPEPEQAVLIGSTPTDDGELVVYYYQEEEKNYLLINSDLSRLEWGGGYCVPETVEVGGVEYSRFKVPDEVLNEDNLLLLP